MEARFHHVGYATKSIEKSLEFFQKLGYKAENSIVQDKVLGVKVLFLLDTLNHGPRIELVEDLVNGEIHPVQTILNQRPGSYHFAYSIDSIQEFSIRNKLRAVTLCSPALAFGGRHVQFFVSRDEGIIELISNTHECLCGNNG
jgi:methylmalonyl-CoA/ethylmalonyl-CoA epimerase